MKDMIKRYFFFILGLIINSFGIAFITKSALGTSPISSVPYVFSLRFDGFSFGGFTFIMNMLFILLQVLLLRKNFQLIQLLQIGANFLFSAFIDIGMSALSWLNSSSIPLRLISLAIGCVILAFGICVEVAPDVIVVPGEGVVRAISRVSGREFGKVKICFDVTLIAISFLSSLLFFHVLQGIGIGTVISALAVGPIVSFFNRHLPLTFSSDPDGIQYQRHFWHCQLHG